MGFSLICGGGEKKKKKTREEEEEVDPLDLILSTEEVIPAESIKKIKILEEGENGSVWKAVYEFQTESSNSSSLVALKPLGEVRSAGDSEWSVLQQLHHQNIVKYVGLHVDKEGGKFMTLEYLDGRTLLDYFEYEKIKMPKRISIYYKIAEAFAYLEEQKIVHNNLCASNVFLKPVGRDDVEVKILGFSMAVKEENSVAKDQFAYIPFRWSAPEALKREKTDCKADVWSFGVVVWETMEGGARPYGAWEVIQVEKQVLKGWQLTFASKKWTSELKDLCTSCWKMEPSDRPDFITIKNNLLDIHQKTIEGGSKIMKMLGRSRAPTLAPSSLSSSPSASPSKLRGSPSSIPRNASLASKSLDRVPSKTTKKAMETEDISFSRSMPINKPLKRDVSRSAPNTRPQSKVVVVEEVKVENKKIILKSGSEDRKVPPQIVVTEEKPKEVIKADPVTTHEGVEKLQQEENRPEQSLIKDDEKLFNEDASVGATKDIEQSKEEVKQEKKEEKNMEIKEIKEDDAESIVEDTKEETQKEEISKQEEEVKETSSNVEEAPKITIQTAEEDKNPSIVTMKNSPSNWLKLSFETDVIMDAPPYGKPEEDSSEDTQKSLAKSSTKSDKKKKRSALKEEKMKERARKKDKNVVFLPKEQEIGEDGEGIMDRGRAMSVTEDDLRTPEAITVERKIRLFQKLSRSNLSISDAIANNSISRSSSNTSSNSKVSNK